jgi:hypothetical protein
MTLHALTKKHKCYKNKEKGKKKIKKKKIMIKTRMAERVT